MFDFDNKKKLRKKKYFFCVTLKVDVNVILKLDELKAKFSFF